MQPSNVFQWRPFRFNSFTHVFYLYHTDTEDFGGYTYDEYSDSMPGSDLTETTESSNSTSTVSDGGAVKEKAAVADSDRFFTQYGGDIEYFFPLIQFGIPFDGEITLLGFKGFKGLWPY